MTLFKKCQTFVYRISRRFHSAMATLEPQNNVIAGTVGTENILLASCLQSNRIDTENDKNSNFQQSYPIFDKIARDFVHYIIETF